MTHYRMSFDDWLDQCRYETGFSEGNQFNEWMNERPEHRHFHRVNGEDAADYVRDCIANQTVRDIDGPIP